MRALRLPALVGRVHPPEAARPKRKAAVRIRTVHACPDCGHKLFEDELPDGDGQCVCGKQYRVERGKPGGNLVWPVEAVDLAGQSAESSRGRG